MLRITNGLLFPQFSPPKDTYVPDTSIDNFQSEDTLQSLVQSCSCGNLGREKSIKHPTECKHISSQHKSASERTGNPSPYSLLSFTKNTGTGSYKCSKHQQEKLSPCSSEWTTISVTASVVPEKRATKNKTRIRWTDDLHDKFIDSVNHLGGAKKATPKGILKLMNCDGLTIFHIKSHLQKYRVAGVMPGATEGNVEQPDLKTGEQIVEAIRLQMDVQRRLYEQLESQKELQMRIEEQAKQLQTMIESQQKTKKNL